MTRYTLMLSIALCGVVLMGCKKDEDATPVPTGTEADKAVKDAAADAKAAADKAMADKAVTDKAAADKVAADKAMADKVAANKVAAAKAMADKAAADKAAAAKAAADKATATAKTEADSILKKILQLIKDAKLGDADTELKGLEAKQASMPTDIQARIKAARTSLDAAKAAEKVKLPGLPK